ncbi:GTP-binding protein [Trypanosoma grayi]|uniref:GTP-binding protein n=1 Tax=Trypanosoma grayi TaxID=71804 RepID=UPI0004F4906A|nr:GTP-binding protein [Trypanosoma grayi]KEG07547.1 GTP-binding protein [Trypanosoma grayi]
MAFRHSDVCLFLASAVTRSAHPCCSTRVLRHTGKIVIPKLPSVQQQESSVAASAAVLSSSPSSSKRRSEYRENKHLDPRVAQFLAGNAADTLRRQQQLDQFRTATDNAAVKVWRDSKGHLRRHEALVKDMGVEGAVREMLQPTRVSFRHELRQRPLDRGILEEVYKGLHGRRIERRLKRGVSWEHWITKGDGTAPVFTASRKAQQTFAFGGAIRLEAKATHAKQFPILHPNGKRGRGSSSKSKSENKNKISGEDKVALLEEEGAVQRLVPELAFIGRTSSGKSSLINAIVNAMVAPYGHLQGTTSSVNFYNVANKVVLVDCPGYGYYNPMETPDMDAANAVAAMRAYLATCSSSSSSRRSGESTRGGGTSEAGRHGSYQVRPIRRVFVCISARGLQHTDIAYLDHLEELGVPFSVVLTKTDAAPIRFLTRLADHTRCKLVHYKHCKELMLTSSLRLAGIDKMQSLIGGMALGEDKLHGATTDFSTIV